MRNRGEHCPFLNRANARCGENLSIDALTYAFAHCFHAYDACPLYRELRDERERERRRVAGAGRPGELVVTRDADDDNPPRHDDETRFTPLTVTARHPERFGGAAGVPCLPGVGAGPG